MNIVCECGGETQKRVVIVTNVGEHKISPTRVTMYQCVRCLAQIIKDDGAEKLLKKLGGQNEE